jgi:hypothetical protein
MILNEADLEIIVTVAHRTQEVSDMKFSPGEQIFPQLTSIDSSFAMSQTIATWLWAHTTTSWISTM